LLGSLRDGTLTGVESFDVLDRSDGPAGKGPAGPRPRGGDVSYGRCVAASLRASPLAAGEARLTNPRDARDQVRPRWRSCQESITTARRRCRTPFRWTTAPCSTHQERRCS
jgi:hypothetical protein